MKPITTRFLTLALGGALVFGLSACSEQSMDNAVNNNGDDIAGSIAEQSEQQQSKDLTDGDLDVKPRWQIVETVKGSSDRVTDPFKIDSPKWRIGWDTEASEEMHEFFIILKEVNTGEEQVIATNPADDLAEIDVSGEFELEVRAKQPYKITVKEFK